MKNNRRQKIINRKQESRSLKFSPFVSSKKRHFSVFRASCLISCFSLFLFFNSPPLLKAATINFSSREERLAIFDDVWQTINDRYYDAKMRGINWLSLRSSFRERAAQTTEKTEFYRLLRSMINELHDSHTRVYAPDERIDWRNPRVVGVGLSIREIEDELVVVNVEKDSLAESVGIKLGDVIAQIDNIPAKTVFARKIIDQRGSSTASAGKLKAAASVFDGAANTLVTVVWRNSRGKERQATLKRELRELSSRLRVRREDNVLIIAFDAFVPETVSEFFRVLSLEIYDTRGIVLDLRQNRGGSAEAMTDVAAAFLPSNHDLGKFIDRDGNVMVAAQTHSWLLFAPNLVQAQNVPVVILTGTATASAAEIFAAALKSANRAQTVGTTTCGCVLAIRRQHSLSDGGVLEVSELDFQTPSGRRLEGFGVAPTFYIQQTRNDIRQKRDKALEQALKIING